MDKKYSYQEFKCVIAEAVKRSFPGEVDIEIHNVVKNNSVELEGMILVEDGKSVSPDFYLQLYYEEYSKGICIEEIIDDILRKYNETRNQDFGNFNLDIGNCLDKIVCRLVSFEKNRKLLDEIPYIPFLDMAVVFFCLVIENKDGIGSIRINNKVMDKWGITVKKLYQIAIRNTERLFPKVFCPLTEMLKNLIEKEDSAGIYNNSGGISLKDVNVPFILTNRTGINGASVVLYPDCLKEIGRTAGMDLFILPSSIHELLVVPDDGRIAAEDLKKMVKEVNVSCVVAEEVLSDMVYHYSAGKNIIEICV